MRLLPFALLLPFAFLLEDCSEVPCPEELIADARYLGEWSVTMTFDEEVTTRVFDARITELDTQEFNFLPTVCFNFPLAREIFARSTVEWFDGIYQWNLTYSVDGEIVNIDSYIGSSDIVDGQIATMLEPSEDGDVLMGSFVIQDWFHAADDDEYPYDPVSGTIVAERQR